MSEEEKRRLLELMLAGGQTPYAAPGTSAYSGFNVASPYMSDSAGQLMQFAPKQSFGPPPTQQEMDALAFGGGGGGQLDTQKMKGLFSLIKEKTAPGVTWNDGILGFGGNYAGRAGPQNPNVVLPNNFLNIRNLGF